MTEKPIPNYVDDQMQVFFWEMDEFIPSVAMFIIFFWWDQPLLGLIIAYFFVKFLSRFKNMNMPGVLFHISWWSGALSMNKRFPNGLIRELVR